jgi:hypothetical protein
VNIFLFGVPAALINYHYCSFIKAAKAGRIDFLALSDNSTAENYG